MHFSSFLPLARTRRHICSEIFRYPCTNVRTHALDVHWAPAPACAALVSAARTRVTHATPGEEDAAAFREVNTSVGANNTERAPELAYVEGVP